MDDHGKTLGARYLGEGRCAFLVWAPRAQQVDLRLKEPRRADVRLEPRAGGYHGAVVEGVEPGARYTFVLDGEVERPDPASRSQPAGVHGPSEVVNPHFGWTADGWRGVPLAELVFYELHVGTYTPEGTFAALEPHLRSLAQLGVTAIELMPIAQFPGSRNWGYDGVFPFAAQASYGGLAGLRRLVDACHREGLALFVDVVYNHLGPEGNYLAEFGEYFTGNYRTPWGAAVNVDGAGSDEVRRYLVENALFWLDECRCDGLRLDAVHAIYDFSASPFLAELAAAVDALARRTGRAIHVVAESDLNDSRLVRGPAQGGNGLAAQWCDDFHHALHVALTGERSGYYADFRGAPDLARSFAEAYVYSGQRSAARRRRHGNAARDLPPARFVVFAQNHDQVGNRMLGERLVALAGFEKAKLAAAAVLLSPYLPLLFMGEEYGETAPFLYFVSHSDADLVEAVRNGRRDEFGGFGWQAEPPDPQAEATFATSRLDHGLKEREPHRTLLSWYRALLERRRARPAGGAREDVEACCEGDAVVVLQASGGAESALVLHFGDAARELELPLRAGAWRKALDSAEPAWRGPGSDLPALVHSGGRARARLAPHQAALFERTA
ncbi:MAG: malto-oligosyltrehalose trehalohydrolase [Acidobacteria bacterium]|nr:malto-oligosyltrehalose trehalohydrolase [Acidobacteriota bacterium]